MLEPLKALVFGAAVGILAGSICYLDLGISGFWGLPVGILATVWWIKLK